MNYNRKKPHTGKNDLPNVITEKRVVYDGKTKHISELLRSTSSSMSIPRQRTIFGLLVKEDFRNYIALTAYNTEYFIDSDKYVKIPDVVGCFHTYNEWIVYETDEKGMYVNARKYQSAVSAFKDAAARRGLSYCPRQETLSFERIPCSIKQINTELLALKSALATLNRVNEFLVVTDHPDAVKRDIKVLVAVQENEERRKKSISRGNIPSKTASCFGRKNRSASRVFAAKSPRQKRRKNDKKQKTK